VPPILYPVKFGITPARPISIGRPDSLSVTWKQSCLVGKLALSKRNGARV